MAGHPSLKLRLGKPAFAQALVRQGTLRLPSAARRAMPGLWCKCSISPCEGDGPGANPGFLSTKENARRALKEIGLSASGSCSKEQSQPRHEDLNAGIWIRAVRRARKASQSGGCRANKSYSQFWMAFSDFDGPNFAGYRSKRKGVVAHREGANLLQATFCGNCTNVGFGVCLGDLKIL